MVQTEGMLQTRVRHQECPALRDHEGQTNKKMIRGFNSVTNIKLLLF